jgi:alpha-N-arabinofuranosidase
MLPTSLILAPEATEIHVSPLGDDAHSGTGAAPLRTIQAAANLAQPGDVITVHAGVYRERITPPRGGLSDDKRIVYQAADDGKVEIKGSEIVRTWEKIQDDVWKAILPNAMFGSFNPYSDVIHGDWFDGKGRTHHTGAVYLNGEWLVEAATMEEVMKPATADPLWYAQVDDDRTTIWAQFKEANPNEQLVEIHVRQSVFYPAMPGVNYLTVRGFTLCQAATPWAPPTAEQIGLIGTHWSKGWIIENNVIRHSVCSGIALGKHGDEFDNKSADTAEGYVKTIERAHDFVIPWTKENIGHHIVRNNTISHCEQTGIVGSLGAVFSRITGNTIHDIHTRALFTGAEMAGIKLHAAIDVEIRGNHIYRACRGLWLDWMAQGARVSGNLFHDNPDQDLFVEVNHGPFLVDNNIFLSPMVLLTISQGGAYVHNLMAGSFQSVPIDERLTPFHKAHSTELAGMHDNPAGDDRYYHNLLVGQADLGFYDTAAMPVQMEGNVFLMDAKPSTHEASPLVHADFNPQLKLIEKSGAFFLEIQCAPAPVTGVVRKFVTTGMLGKAGISGCAYENPDGSSVRIDADYFGLPRQAAQSAAGPFASSVPSSQSIQVWPKS